MTTHRLKAVGSRRTVCELTVPSIVTLKLGASSWEDGDDPGRPGGPALCLDGCWPIDVGDGAARVGEPLRHYDVFSHRRVKGQTLEVPAGKAHERHERDGSIVVLLDVLPMEGTLVLRLKGGAP